MAHNAQCRECGHSWTMKKPPDEYDDGPKCSECNRRTEVSVESDGPGFDPAAAVGTGGGDDQRVEDLTDSLKATPGVGQAGVDYAVYWFKNGSDDAESLHDVLLEVDGVGTQAARRIVESVLGEQGEPDGAAPLTLDGPDGGGGDGETFIDQLVKAKRAGLLGDDGGGSTDAEAVAQAVSEAMAPALKRVSQTQQMLAESRQDGDSELDELRQQVEELREEREREELQELEAKIDNLERDSDPEIARLQETRELLSDAPEVSATAAREWARVAHSVLDRAKSHEIQREIMAAEGDNRPAYSPQRPAAQGRPRQQAPMRPAQERPGSRPQATADGGTRGGGSHAPAGGDGDDAADEDAEPTDEDAEGRADAIRDKLGLSSGGESA